MGSSYGLGNAELSSAVECIHGVALVGGLCRAGKEKVMAGRGNVEGKNCIALVWVVMEWDGL